MAVYRIPLSPAPQRFTINLGGTEYGITLRYRNANMGGWAIDIADRSGAQLVNGIPLVTGCDLLSQYGHLGFSGELRVQTSDDPDATPTFSNLGDQSHLYWITA